MSPATLTGTPLEAALGYAREHRFPGFAVEAGGKRPHRDLSPRGFKDATLDEATIRRVFEADPEANVAVATGCPLPAGGVLAVIDVDTYAEGDETLEAFLLNLGADLPETAEVATGGGGRHLYYRAPVGTRSTRLGPGLDLKAGGGYVVAPPSAHASGRLYAWHPSRTLGDVPLAALPGCFLAGEDRGSGERTPPEEWVRVLRRGAARGERNITCARLAGHLLRRGVDPAVTVELLVAWDARNRPPMGPGEVTRTVASIAKREAERLERRAA